MVPHLGSGGGTGASATKEPSMGRPVCEARVAGTLPLVLGKGGSDPWVFSEMGCGAERHKEEGGLRPVFCLLHVLHSRLLDLAVPSLRPSSPLFPALAAPICLPRSLSRHQDQKPLLCPHLGSPPPGLYFGSVSFPPQGQGPSFRPGCTEPAETRAHSHSPVHKR